MWKKTPWWTDSLNDESSFYAAIPGGDEMTEQEFKRICADHDDDIIEIGDEINNLLEKYDSLQRDMLALQIAFTLLCVLVGVIYFIGR